MRKSGVFDFESLAIDILTFLTGISSRDGEQFPVLRKAIRAVTNSEERSPYYVLLVVLTLFYTSACIFPSKEI